MTCTIPGMCSRSPDCSDDLCPGHPARYGYPTTRRYPRTLADAFPDERCKAFERHVAPSIWERIRLFFRRNLNA